ncbi:MAG: dolichyl-phosphate-mannose--protein mannosyltransferase [Alistipes sp.]|nr:dolichyl-phosphate-mannose--protein mannosyltransferase [Alistipes sp.]
MKRAATLLPYIFFAALLPAMILRDFTPSNELRYLSIADEALRDGHLFAFTCQGEPYADKPPLYLWAVMAGRALLGDGCMWFLALFSIIPALVVIRTVDSWTRSLLGEGWRTAAMLMLMTGALFAGLSVVLRPDMLMVMFIVLSLRTFWRIHSGERDTAGQRMLFALYVFGALFSKGPVGILMPLVTTLLFLAVSGRLREAGRCWGWRTWLILAVCCAAWFGNVYLEGGTEYLDNLLFHQTVDRAVDAFHHKQPVWYYVVALMWSLAPWSLLAVGAIAVGARRLKLTGLERFFLTASVSTFVMLSAFSSKLAVYLAPIFPFVVYLAALLLQRMQPAGRWPRVLVAIPAAIFAAVLPGVAVAAHMPGTEFLKGWLCLTAAAILSIGGAAALAMLFRRREAAGGRVQGAVCTLACGMLAALFVGGFALPSLNGMIGYGPMCRQAMELARSNGAEEYYVWKIRRPESMDVYLGRDIVEVSADDILQGRCAGGVLMLDSRKLAADEALSACIAPLSPQLAGPYTVVAVPACGIDADAVQAQQQSPAGE